METRKAIKLAANTMFIVGKIATADDKVNYWLQATGKTVEELRNAGVNAIGFYPNKTVAYYNYQFSDNCVDNAQILNAKVGA
jgi:hypothetical protein